MENDFQKSYCETSFSGTLNSDMKSEKSSVRRVQEYALTTSNDELSSTHPCSIEVENLDFPIYFFASS